MNFATEVVGAVSPSKTALLALSADGSRRQLSFGEVSERSARLASTLTAHGAAPGSVVMTVIGNRPEWVETMVACFRIGAIALPCTEQLRPKDLRARMELAEPRVVVADERDAEAVREAGFEGPLLTVPDDSLYETAAAPAVDLAPEDPALITFTSGTAGEPKPIRHGQRYLFGQRVQAEHWFGARDRKSVV